MYVINIIYVVYNKVSVEDKYIVVDHIKNDYNLFFVVGFSNCNYRKSVMRKFVRFITGFFRKIIENFEKQLSSSTNCTLLITKNHLNHNY